MVAKEKSESCRGRHGRAGEGKPLIKTVGLML